MRLALLILLLVCNAVSVHGAESPVSLLPIYNPPPELKDNLGKYQSPLISPNGGRITSASGWQQRRQEILKMWEHFMGPWPGLVTAPKVRYLEQTNRDNFVQHRVELEIAPGRMAAGYLLVPGGAKKMPAVIVPFYEPETSIGKGKPLLDFGYQLARRGFVTLSIGSPGGDAWKPETGKASCQPLSFLAYVAANCHTALSQMKEVDGNRIGIVGHSYGGKWAMFASCLYEKFACAVWCDPGIVWDETRSNVNYWEPWYLGLDPMITRKPGIPTANNPRTGAYKELVAAGHDLHELHALMAPRPFLVSGGSEDPPERWLALNSTVQINTLLGYTNRVAMTNRKTHSPTAESNAQLYAFLEAWLGKASPSAGSER